MPCATAVILDPSAREGGSFRSPRYVASGDEPDRVPPARIELRVFQDRWFFNCILCQKWYCFCSFFGISILLVDLVRDFYIGTGFLEAKIAPEPPPGREDLKK